MARREGNTAGQNRNVVSSVVNIDTETLQPFTYGFVHRIRLTVARSKISSLFRLNPL